MNKELVVGRSLQKAVRLCHQAPLLVSVAFFLYLCLKEAQFFFRFKYLFFDFTFKDTAMQIEKALMNDRLRVSKVS